MSKSLPPKPNMENLKSQSKTLLQGYKNNKPEAISGVSSVYQLLPKALNQNMKKLASGDVVCTDP